MITEEFPCRKRAPNSYSWDGRWHKEAIFFHPKWLPSGYVKIAIENGPVEIVDFPMKNGGSFHSYVNVYRRVSSSYGLEQSCKWPICPPKKAVIHRQNSWICWGFLGDWGIRREDVCFTNFLGLLNQSKWTAKKWWSNWNCLVVWNMGLLLGI